ncbi:hypothetical protein ACQ4PT_049229 [Festuca glaucescens]
MEEPGFRQGAEAQIGGIVDMEDDVYLEFDEEEEVKKDPDEAPSAIKLDAVPVWVRIYDVPFGKQHETWGMRYGNGLGEALEVDVPASELKKQEFLRDDCEKRRIGIPSLDYDAHELRCSPFKKFEHRSHSIPPAGHPSARRGLSFPSFGSAESHKRFGQGQAHEANTTTPIQSRSGSVDNNMPPLMVDIIPGVIDGFGNIVEHVASVPKLDGFEGKEVAGPPEEELNLAAKVDAMHVEIGHDLRSPASLPGRDGSQPIIQFPEEELQGETVVQHRHMHLGMTSDMLEHMQRLKPGQGTGASSGSWGHGPRPSDMILVLQGLSSLQVSFGSASDVAMISVDTVLGKRGAEE